MSKVYIDGSVYNEDDCVYMDGGWFLKTDSRIVKDYLTGCYEFKAHCISTKRNGVNIYTHKTHAVIGHDGTHFFDVQHATELGYKELVKRGIFHMPGSGLRDTYQPYQKFGMQRKFKEDLITKSSGFTLTDNKRFPFGVEIETVNGYVPIWAIHDIPVKCVFDGSLRTEAGRDPSGGEYVTGILQGNTGMRYLNKLCSELSKRTVINHLCSVHVHISDESLDVKRDTIVYLYKLCMMLEEELFAMMPKSRASNSYCNFMKKIPISLDELKRNYNESISKYHNKIQDIIATGLEHSGKDHDHPRGHHCNYDKSTPRYWWINFVPAMFNTRKVKSYSVEFRQHAGTLNYFKIKYWIKICIAIFDVAENHRMEIREDMKLVDVLKLAYPTNYTKLNTYVENRKKLFATDELSKANEALEYSTSVEETLKVSEL